MVPACYSNDNPAKFHPILNELCNSLAKFYFSFTFPKFHKTFRNPALTMEIGAIPDNPGRVATLQRVCNKGVRALSDNAVQHVGKVLIDVINVLS